MERAVRWSPAIVKFDELTIGRGRHHRPFQLRVTPHPHVMFSNYLKDNFGGKQINGCEKNLEKCSQTFSWSSMRTTLATRLNLIQSTLRDGH